MQCIAGNVLLAQSGCKPKGWLEQVEILGQGQLPTHLKIFRLCVLKKLQVLGTEADYYVAEAQ